MHRTAILFFLLFISIASYGQQYSFQFIDTKTSASFRALSVADENAVWVSGSKGWVGRSINGGKDWTFKQVPGYENCDFRSLYAFDADNAVIANAGSPAYILRTNDGGKSWTQAYKNADSAAFIDGVDFWNKKKGLMYGDPINGRMLLLYTKDGGRTWEACEHGSKMSEGEASFAASGTNIKCIARKTVVIAAGGKRSELFISRNKGKSWRSLPTPMLASSESTGIFSFMAAGKRNWLIAGGDYKHDSVRTANFFYTKNKGKQWLAPVTTTQGYRECLGKTDKVMFAVGPTGIDISTDMGIHWKALSDEKGFHVIKAGKDGKHMFLAGSNGKLAIMKTTP